MNKPSKRIIEKLHEALLKRVRHHPGKSWVNEQAQEGKLDYEWDNSSVAFEDALADLEDEAKKWANKEGLNTTEKQVQKAIQEANRNDIAESIAKYEAIRPFIEECRHELFGSKETPFSNDEKGFENAKDWLEKTYNEQEKTRTHYRVEIKGNATLTKSAFARFEVERSGEPPSGEGLRKAFVETVTGAEQTFLPSFVIPSLLFNLTLDKHDFTIVVHGGTELYGLVNRIGVQSLHSNWFTATEIIRLVFFDVIYTKKLIETGYTVGPPSFDPDHPNSITLTIRGSVSEDEVLRAYRGQLKERNLKVRKKRLSYQGQQILIFVNANRKNKTWDERTKMWNGLCEHDKRLKPYGKQSRGGLVQAFNRAVAQTSWNAGPDDEKAEQKRKS